MGVKMKKAALWGLAVLLTAFSCAKNTPENPEEELSGSSKSASVCGKLKSGEYLDRGQSVSSCAGNATLVHQSTDGNVVLYGPSGWLWQSGTSGKATTRFIMQTDGNLVLYNGGIPLWSTGTNGKNGATLSIQDDCNMVIYNTAGQPIWAASWVSSNWRACAAPSGIDTLAYMTDSSKLTSTQTLEASNDSNQVSKLRVDSANSKFWYIKQRPDSGKRWERYRWDSSYIYLEKDTTLPAEYSYDAYITSPSFKLGKRYWNVGEKIVDSTYIKHFNFKRSNNCSVLDGNGTYWPYKRTLKARYANANIGGNLTNIDVIIIQVEMPDSGEAGYNYWNPAGIERHWYAKGYGFVRWQEWNGIQRSDGSWQKKNPDSDSPLHDVIFNKISNNNAPGFQDVCTNL